MRLNEVADLHNRRANTNVAAKYFKERDMPYLAWPEDKLLLRVLDLPLLIGIQPRGARSWKPFKPTQRRELLPLTPGDKQLRDFIKTDHLYAITGITERAEGLIYYVTEYQFIN